jgi:hypothetical protein
LGFWVIVPPIWFWFDYFFIYRFLNPNERRPFDDYQFSVDLSAKIWLALVTLRFGLYFGKDLGFFPRHFSASAQISTARFNRAAKPIGSHAFPGSGVAINFEIRTVVPVSVVYFGLRLWFGRLDDG